MATIKPGMTATQINKYLKKYREITIKAGVYDLKKTLILHSNTTIFCEDGVIFNRKHGGRMMQTYVTPDTTKYNGVHDVTWTGGKFVANTNSSSAIVIVIVHSRNIKLNNMEITGCRDLHSIEINSSKDVHVNHTSISNQTCREGEEHKEAIQIDFCFKGGLAIEGAVESSPVYDHTHCEGIVIFDCTFANVPNGIGTHSISEEEDYHTDIQIEQCDFNQIGRNAIRLLGMKNVSIDFCTGDGKIVVDKKKKAKKIGGGNVELKDYRLNQNVVIGDVTIA